MHAKTLRLDECHEPNEGENHEAEVWKKKYADLAARLAKLETAHPLPERMPATPKELFPVTSPSPSVASASATPSPAVPPKAGLIPPAKSPPTVPVPKRSEPPPKAVPPGEPSSSASGERGSLKAGEEEMAEELDLNHEDRAGNMLTIIVFVLLTKNMPSVAQEFRTLSGIDHACIVHALEAIVSEDAGWKAQCGSDNPRPMDLRQQRRIVACAGTKYEDMWIRQFTSHPDERSGQVLQKI